MRREQKILNITYFGHLFFRGRAKINHLVQQAAQQLLSQKNNLKVQKNMEFCILYLVFVNTFGKQLIEQYNYPFFLQRKKGVQNKLCGELFAFVSNYN